MKKLLHSLLRTIFLTHFTSVFLIFNSSLIEYVWVHYQSCTKRGKSGFPRNALIWVYQKSKSWNNCCFVFIIYIILELLFLCNINTERHLFVHVWIHRRFCCGDVISGICFQTYFTALYISMWMCAVSRY